MHVDDVANLRLVCFGAMQRVIDGKEMAIGKLVRSFDEERLS